LLPDAPVPDGRTVLTSPDTHRHRGGRGSREAPPPFIRDTNPLERVNREIGRRTDVVGIFPNDKALIRLPASIVIEQDDEWLVGHRYLSAHSLEAILTDFNRDNSQEEARELTAA
jgi:transposase-like protein